MKKQGLFLAAGLAAVSAGLMVNGSAFAAHATVPLGSEDDIKVAQALANHSNLDSLEFRASGPHPYEEQSVLMIGDGERPTSISFLCNEGDPLEGVKDYSLLSDTTVSQYLADVEYLLLCGAEDVDWDELAKLPSLTVLAIFSPEAYVIESRDSVQMFELRDELAGKPIVDISGIEKLSNLEALYISGIPLGSFQTIPQLDLDTLTLNADAITSIEGFENVFEDTDLEMFYNNIVDFQPVADYMNRTGYYQNETWDFIIDGFDTVFYGNKAIIKTNSETVEIPEYFVAFADLVKGSNANNWYADIVGLDYEIGDTTAKLDLSKNRHYINVWNSRANQTIEFIYEEKQEENPDTLDHSILGWVIGIAAAIMTSTSLMIRSRR